MMLTLDLEKTKGREVRREWNLQLTHSIEMKARTKEKLRRQNFPVPKIVPANLTASVINNHNQEEAQNSFDVFSYPTETVVSYKTIWICHRTYIQRGRPTSVASVPIIFWLVSPSSSPPGYVARFICTSAHVRLENPFRPPM